jgi:branched-chain amino acid aminotransferase
MPIEEVRLSPGQAGLLSGYGLFTTCRITSGIPFAFEKHWKRLKKDAERTHCPFPFEEEIVRGKMLEVVRANGVEEGCARLYVVNNRPTFWSSNEKLPPSDLIIYTSGLPNYKEPSRLVVREQGRHACSPLAGVKVTSWLNNVWNLYEGLEAGYDEVVLLNERGEIAECTAANLFIVKGGTVFTPPLDSGCLEGITRLLLLEMGAGAGVLVEEKTLKPEDLFGADEVFISSTNRSVLGVNEVTEHLGARAGAPGSGAKAPKVHHFKGPGPVTMKLEEVFAAYIKDYVAKARQRSETSAGSARR